MNGQDETYSVPVACSNCSYRGTIHLPKGVAFSDPFFGYKTSHQSCPNCGCNTLVKGISRGPKWNDGLDRYWLKDEGDNRMLCMVRETEHK